MNTLRIKFYNQGNWGQYRNTFVMQSQNLHRRGDEEQARGKAFDPSSKCQAPHTMNMVRFKQENYFISDQNLKKEFIKVADNDSLMETMPLTSEERKKINLNNLMNCTDLSGGSILLKIVRIILAIIVLTLSVYQLITDNFEVMPYSMLFLGALMLVIGLAELQKDRKGFGGYMCIVVSLFLFFVSIQDFLIY